MGKAISYVLIGIFIFCFSIVGCSNESNGSQDSTLNNTHPDILEKKSLKISVAMSSLHEETFLPWQGGGGRKFYLDTIYEYLTYLNPETHELEPGLAESWLMSENGKQWVLHIRKGIQFQKEWGEFTAYDAQYSIERLIHPSAKSGPSSSLRNVIDDVIVLDDYTLKITLKRPDIEFVYGYLSNAMQCMMVSKKYLEEQGDVIAGSNPIGTGAFGLDSHKRGYSISISRSSNTNHWRVKNNTQKITFYSVPEEATRIAMLIAGEVDLSPVNFDSLKALERKKINVLFLKNSWSPIVRFGGLVNTSEVLSNKNVPWQDQRVRQALNYAVDKETILKAIFHGQGRIAGTDFPAEVFFDVKPYPFDPEKAKRLLSEAGYPKGFPITLKTFTTTPGAELPIIAEIIGMYWQQIGLAVDVVPIDWISHRSAQVNGKVNGISWTHRGIAFPTPLVGLQASYSSNSVFSTFATEESEKRLNDIEYSLSLEEREKMIKQFGQYIHDQATGVFLLFSNEPYGVSKRVKHWPSLSQHVTNIDLIELKN
ncbi:MAG: ABC transporter substrate-binding protein [Cellvibrionaceae bacterium]